MLIMIIKFCKFNDDKIFNVTLTFNTNLINLIIIIILSYKLNFKLIN